MAEIEFTKYLNLAAEKFGAQAMECTDDFFASMHNLVKGGRGIFIENKYTEQGKWMDGWESRRKRVSGHDWCTVKLGAVGRIYGVNIDTNHFTGNHPPHASLEACHVIGEDLTSAHWVEILSTIDLNPGSQHLFSIENEQAWSHVRLHIYPDGGVARLKVYGEVVKDWSAVDKSELVDLTSANNGAKSILCNDMYFSHMDNLLMPGRGRNMGDGWETKRNRTPNNRDWVVIRLAKEGVINKLNIDTRHFKGNYPDSCELHYCHHENDDIETMNWQLLLPKMKLQADHEHFIEKNIIPHNSATHVRLSIYPDGGISRLRMWGHIT